MTLTKESIAKLSGIKIELDHFSYVVIDADIIEQEANGSHDPFINDKFLRLSLAKTSEYKKAINQYGFNHALEFLDKKFLIQKEITLKNKEGEKLFFESSIKKLTESLLRIIQVLKQK